MGAKVPGGGRQPAVKSLRVQFHLGGELIERLGVHATLVHRSQSAVVEEVLGAYLTRHGRGRELWASGDREDREGQVDPPT